MEENILPHSHGEGQRLALGGLPRDEVFFMISELFRVFGDEKRIKLYWILLHCEECVVDLSAMMNMSSSSVSHHLGQLKRAGLVVNRREGKEVYYTATPCDRTRHLHDIIERLAELSCPTETISAPNTAEYDTNAQTVVQVHDFLLENIGQRYTIEELSERFLINRTTLKTSFKAQYGASIGAYMKNKRMERARELLCLTDASVGSIAQDVGYSSGSKFTTAFREYTGMLPKDYRRINNERRK